MNYPKTDLTHKRRKDRDEWVSGDDPMAGTQASYLKTLSEQAGVDGFNARLTRAAGGEL